MEIRVKKDCLPQNLDKVDVIFALMALNYLSKINNSNKQSITSFFSCKHRCHVSWWWIFFFKKNCYCLNCGISHIFSKKFFSQPLFKRFYKKLFFNADKLIIREKTANENRSEETHNFILKIEKAYNPWNFLKMDVKPIKINYILTPINVWIPYTLYTIAENAIKFLHLKIYYLDFKMETQDRHFSSAMWKKDFSIIEKDKSAVFFIKLQNLSRKVAKA